jgi:magnesium-transporting ATPase (P-type)
VEVLRDGTFKVVPSRLLRVGDIVRVHKEAQFPADLLLLSSSDPTSICYVETSNLDGESNLKRLYSMAQTSALDTDEKIARTLQIRVVVEPPNDRLYKFQGKMLLLASDGSEIGNVTDESWHPIKAENVCLRGARLKRTAHMHGMVVYAGMNTKLQKNARKAKSKFSQVDIRLNRCVAPHVHCRTEKNDYRRRIAVGELKMHTQTCTT